MSEETPVAGEHKADDIPSPLFTGAVYDKLKVLVQVVLPGVITLYTALAGLWEWSNTLQVVGTLGALNTFLGLLVGASSSKFNAAQAIKAERKQAGFISATGGFNELSGHPDLALTLTKDPAEILEKGEVTLKVGPPPPAVG